LEFKHWLYFGLGTAATIPFGLRLFVQWFLSEYKQRSHVTSIFWTFSIIGNFLMLAHYLIQVQFHLYFIRFLPTYFAFRQIYLIRGNAKPFSWPRLLRIFSLLTLGFTAIFVLRVYLEHKRIIWIINPQMPWETAIKNVSSLWHLAGFIGATIFASRLWMQWWQSEKAHESVLNPSFWWISIIGGSLTLVYAIYIQDLVTALGYSTGMIPYIRNLMLIRKTSKLAKSA
jgi:lipid-A-disaccharide synthase-like uncharacterized protein